MNSVCAELQRMITLLEEDLRDAPDPRLIQLAALKDALSAVSGGRAPSVSRRRGLHSKKALFRRMVGDFINAQGGETHRSEILQHLRANDFFSGHKFNDERTMSKYLSTVGAFVPAGEGRWKCAPICGGGAPMQGSPNFTTSCEADDGPETYRVHRIAENVSVASDEVEEQVRSERSERATP